MLGSIIYWLFNVYIIGLFVYVTLERFPDNKKLADVHTGMEPYYAPLLRPIQHHIKLTTWGNFRLDLAPIVLFLVLLCMRHIVVAFANQ